MDELAACLARFNRAEPDLLFRDAFGHQSAPLRLDAEFRERISAASGAPSIPDTAWWAAEFPFNALSGGIALYVDGTAAVGATYSNASGLIEAGRQDVDFLLSFDTHLILIEAKAYTSNNNRQVSRKLCYLDRLWNFYRGMQGAEKRPINFYFVLASPKPPQRLNVDWPDWLCRGQTPPWMPLKIDQTSQILQTTRCSENGESMATGDQWRIMSSKAFMT